MTQDDRGDPRASARAGVVDLEGRLSDAGHAGAPSPHGAPALRLHPWIEVFPSAGGDVYLLRPGDERDVVIRQPADADRRILERLAAGETFAASAPEAGRLDGLRAAGLVIAQADATTPERFSRQAPYLAGLTDPNVAMARLRDAHVCILGCGGLGTWALAAMASMGVGAFTLVDDDTVEPSNLNRQILFGVADLGASKVDRAAAWVAGFDPAIRVEAVHERVAGTQDAAALAAGADLLVLAADWPPYELGRWVNEACVAAGVPFVTAGQAPPLLRVGPAYVPGDGPCFACHEQRLAEGFPLYAELAEHRRRHGTTATTLGPASGLIGSVLALEALHLLTGTTEPLATKGRALLVDIRTLETRWETVERHPDCPVCG